MYGQSETSIFSGGGCAKYRIITVDAGERGEQLRSPQTVSKSPFSLKQNWGGREPGKAGRGRGDVPQRGANVHIYALLGALKRRLNDCTRVNSGYPS